MPSLLLKYQQKKEAMVQSKYHQVLQLEWGKAYDLVINNIADMAHPIHLHGYEFYLMGRGRANAGMFNASSALRNVQTAILRDTVQVEAKSWAVLRFVADNPGVWMLHCHVAYHLDSGMLLLLDVGPAAAVPAPPEWWQTWSRVQPAVANVVDVVHVVVKYPWLPSWWMFASAANAVFFEKGVLGVCVFFSLIVTH